jgi:hypothetical protein
LPLRQAWSEESRSEAEQVIVSQIIFSVGLQILHSHIPLHCHDSGLTIRVLFLKAIPKGSSYLIPKNLPLSPVILSIGLREGKRGEKNLIPKHSVLSFSKSVSALDYRSFILTFHSIATTQGDD